MLLSLQNNASPPILSPPLSLLPLVISLSFLCSYVPRRRRNLVWYRLKYCLFLSTLTNGCGRVEVVVDGVVWCAVDGVSEVWGGRRRERVGRTLFALQGIVRGILIPAHSFD